jgi:hypothetical protein
MRQIDMSAAAVTARLKLVSQLRRLCLALGTSNAKSKPVAGHEGVKKSKQALEAPQHTSK